MTPHRAGAEVRCWAVCHAFDNRSAPGSPTDTATAACDRSWVIVMIIVGIVLLAAGFLLNISFLWSLGIVVVIVGLLMELVGRTGHAVGGRGH
jgi:hypothetical protein